MGEIQKLGPNFVRCLGQGRFLCFSEALKRSGYPARDSLPCTLERFAFGMHHQKAFLRSDSGFPFSLKLDEDQTFIYVKASINLWAPGDPKSGP